jgi:hypothetical protein
MIVSCEPLVGIDFIRVLGTGRGCFACAMQDGQNANAKYYDEPKEVIDEKPLFLLNSLKPTATDHGSLVVVGMSHWYPYLLLKNPWSG